MLSKLCPKNEDIQRLRRKTIRALREEWLMACFLDMALEIDRLTSFIENRPDPNHLEAKSIFRIAVALEKNRAIKAKGGTYKTIMK